MNRLKLGKRRSFRLAFCVPRDCRSVPNLYRDRVKDLQEVRHLSSEPKQPTSLGERLRDTKTAVRFFDRFDFFFGLSVAFDVVTLVLGENN